jgi:hypothetical protein
VIAAPRTGLPTHPQERREELTRRTRHEHMVSLAAMLDVETRGRAVHVEQNSDTGLWRAWTGHRMFERAKFYERAEANGEIGALRMLIRAMRSVRPETRVPMRERGRSECACP